MTIYTCKRCLKDFSQKSHYDSHMRRKNPCKDKSSDINAFIKKTIQEEVNKMKEEIMKSIDEKITFSKYCFEDGCKTISNFNYKGQKKGLYCLKHKKDDMINVVNKRCQEDDCTTRASYNYEGKKALYCSKHKIDGMINIVSKRCREDGCMTVPNYNFEDKKKGLYCLKHKKDNMINIVTKRCREDDCNKNPLYNFEGKKNGLYCLKHKKDGMIDIVNKRCQEYGCKIQSTYNYEGEKKGLYCKSHKKENMIDIRHKRCQEDGCNTRPSYNYKDEKKSLYCLKHKKENMIDIISKRCYQDGCMIRPTYNYEGKKALYCKKHKKDNMIDVLNKKCLENNCINIPNFNYEGKKKGIYCSKHKKNNMVDVIHKKCKAEYGCTIQVNTKLYKGYCLRCFQYLFPDEPITRNYKTKEREVVNFIKNEFNNYDWVADKKIADGCSKRRPDLYIDLGYQIIIIEIDEDQHNQYDCSCENKRLMEISQDFDHRPLVFIRFNPDKYTTLENKNNNSCWKIKRDTGRCMISRKTEWKRRLNILKNQVSYWLNEENKTNKTIKVVHLFFNGFD